MILDKTAQKLNGSLFFVGIMMLVLNMWSRYIIHEFSDSDEEYRQNIILRRVAVFAVCFVGTRDVITALILTGSFIVLSTGLYHAKSVYAREGMENLPQKGASVIMAATH